MNYPMKNRYLKFRKIDREHVCIEHYLTGDVWETDVRFARFVKGLDGHVNPYKMGSEFNREYVEKALAYMEDEGMLDSGERVMKDEPGLILYTLWIPRLRRVHRILATVWNKLLMLLWLPVLIAGIHVFMNIQWRWIEDDWGTVKGYLIGVGAGALLHELSHAAACLSYGGNFFEMGVMIRKFMPGAYVVIDYDNIKNRFARMQIHAAGVQCNAMLAGVFLCFLKMEFFNSNTLIIAAILNGLLGIFNLSLLDGLDGMHMYQELLGCDRFFEKAKGLIFNRTLKKKLRQEGINGNAVIAACYLIVLLQVLMPLVLLTNVITIAGVLGSILV